MRNEWQLEQSCYFYEVTVKALAILIRLRCVAKEINAKLALIRQL